MLLKPYDLVCLAHASDLVADEAAGITAIVDPQRDINPYLHDASQLGLDIRYPFLTHVHADSLAGHLFKPRDLCPARHSETGDGLRPGSDGLT